MKLIYNENKKDKQVELDHLAYVILTMLHKYHVPVSL